MNWFKACAAVLGVCLVVGCGAGGSSVPYEGIVTLNGEPLAEANIVLLPLNANSEGPFSGTTDSSGKFLLGRTGQPDQPGVAPGAYRLTISTLKVAPSQVADDTAKPQILAPERVPDEYRTGNMRVEVPAEGSTAANFDITGQP